MWIALIALTVVFLLIATRQVGSFRVQIWQAMLGGALVVLLFGEIAPLDALHAIKWDVIVFLACMFLVGRGLEESGYLEYLSHKLFKQAGSMDLLLLLTIFGAGLLSMLLMNDTIAIIGTPLVILLSQRHKMSVKVLLLALCFAVTIGSVASPIGNPQNLLVASAMRTPFTSFAVLLIPTLICLLLCYVVLRLFYWREMRAMRLKHAAVLVKDRQLAAFAVVSMLLLLAGIFYKVLVSLFFSSYDVPLVLIAALSAIPMLLSAKRVSLVKTIDWSTLVFFVAMFVLMDAVWRTGVFQGLVSSFAIASLPVIFFMGVVVSQFISNVPLVALYLPMLQTSGASTSQYLALAVASTIAGSLLILGAASNVIIIQNAERHGKTITFLEFAIVGVPLTILCIGVYWLWL